MTELIITPNYAKKTARFKGTIAAGEHVLVKIANDDGAVEDTTNLRLRVVGEGGKTLAQFPMPDTEDAWDGDITPISCEFDLNTDRMLKAVPPAATVPLLFVLDAYKGKTDNDDGEFVLYFKDRCEVTHWPRRSGEDEPVPTILDDYADIIADFREDIYGEGGFRDVVENAASVATDAADRVSAALETADNFVNRAEAAATNAQTSASSAQDSATEAKGWANGGTDGDTPTATNNAKYYAGQAGDAKTDAETAQGAAESAQTAAEAWATGGTGGTPSATNNAKYYAEQAEETLEDKADKATTLAGYGITDAYTKTETDGAIASAVSAEATARDGAIADAISAVKNSAPEAFDTLKEIADWIGDGTSGAQAVISQVANKVDKVSGKGLSTNDYTTAEKQKLSGIAANANAYVLPPATAATLGGVKQGTGCEIAADGTLNVTGGSDGTVDDSVTRTSANPVKSSGIWSAIWGALTALPAGFASLYDYCMGWFADVESIAPLWYTEEITYHVGDLCVESRMGGASGRLFRCKKEYSPDSESNGPSHDTEHWEPIDVVTLIANKQDALTAAQLANIAAVPGKADAAVLRYRIAAAAVRKTLPADCFPVTLIYDGVSYSVNSLVKESEASAAGDMFILDNGTDYTLTMVESPATGSELMSVIEVATFGQGGVFSSGLDDLQFGGVSPVADTSPTLADIHILADRTVNLITATDETSIDIELPAVVTVDGVRRARDFFLDIDNSANASDLALEFTALGVSYAFVPLEDDSISEMMTIGAGERVRLYFTETPYTETGSIPVINVARVTLGDFVTSTTPATQGGN